MQKAFVINRSVRSNECLFKHTTEHSLNLRASGSRRRKGKEEEAIK